MRKVVSLSLALLLAIPVQAQPRAPVRIVSPQVAADRNVTFRIPAPNASAVGLQSSGVFGIDQSNAWEQAHLAALDDAALKNGLELVWFSTGTDDFLIETTRKTVSMIESHGFDVDYTESTGGHTWINWREYLNTFAPQLFK